VHIHKGISSITKSDGPRPKMRVTFRSRTPGCPHEAQSGLGEKDSDDDEIAKRPNFDGCLVLPFVECEATDNAFDFSCSGVSLALDDFAQEDDFFEVKDRKVVIVYFLGNVNGNEVVQ
jgi:hypothetical protein